MEIKNLINVSRIIQDQEKLFVGFVVSRVLLKGEDEEGESEGVF